MSFKMIYKHKNKNIVRVSYDVPKYDHFGKDVGGNVTTVTVHLLRRRATMSPTQDTLPPVQVSP